MDLRGSSTALDTVLFVLLVGAAVGILAGMNTQQPDETRRVTDETADVLATSTTDVTFERAGEVRDGSLLGGGGFEEVRVERRSHGTYAELLASAAISSPELRGRSLTGSGGDYEAAVRLVTTHALPATTANVQVRTRWRPYSGAELGKTIIVGEQPPADASISVATITVASGFPNVSARLESNVQSYSNIARITADGVVTGLFPLNETRDAFASEGPDRAIVASRYRRAATVLGTSVGDALENGDVETANRRLVTALSTRLSADLARQFESPKAAARSIDIDEVNIVVRTWSG